MSNGISQQCAVRPGAVKTAETETSIEGDKNQANVGKNVRGFC